MPSLVFDKCCCCIELKSGCFIIGYLNLVGTLIMTVVTIMAIAGGAVIINDNELKESHDTGLAVVIAASVLLLFLLLALLFAVILLIGLHKEKPGHLKAYLIYSVIFLVITIIQFITTCATTAVTAGSVVQSLLSIILSIYFMLVIRSMYFQMKDPSRGPTIYSAA